MTLVKNKSGYIDQDKPSKVTKQGVRLIDDMPSYRIIGHLARRHRVGLLMSYSLALSGAVVWSKVSWIF